MYRAFRDRASFAFVYIAEAHSVDGWQLQSNEDERVLLNQHVTLEDRFAAAREGAERMGLTLRVLVDRMDDAVSEAFSAWPERIYVVRADGVVGYQGGPGPWGFDPDEATAALERILQDGLM
jgi:Iodothyronine deiodinase